MSRTRSTLAVVLATLATVATTAPAAQAETNRAQILGGYCDGWVTISRATLGGAPWTNANVTCMGNTPRQIIFIVNGSVYGGGPWTGSWSGYAYYIFTGTYTHSWDYWGGKVTACAIVQTPKGANITGACTSMAKGVIS